MTVGSRGVLVGRRVGVGRGDGCIGGIYWGAFVDVSLVLVVGIGLGVCCPLIEAHGGGPRLGFPARKARGVSEGGRGACSIGNFGLICWDGVGNVGGEQFDSRSWRGRQILGDERERGSERDRQTKS